MQFQPNYDRFFQVYPNLCNFVFTQNILLGIDGCIEDAAHWNIDNADASCIGIGWLEKQPRTQ